MARGCSWFRGSGFRRRVQDPGLGNSGSGDLLDHVDHVDGCLHLDFQGLRFSVSLNMHTVHSTPYIFLEEKGFLIIKKKVDGSLEYGVRLGGEVSASGLNI